jgi:hypothetical protein
MSIIALFTVLILLSSVSTYAFVTGNINHNRVYGDNSGSNSPPPSDNSQPTPLIHKELEI